MKDCAEQAMESDFQSTDRKGRFAKLAEEIGSGEYAIERIEEQPNEREICGVNRGMGDFATKEKEIFGAHR